MTAMWLYRLTVLIHVSAVVVWMGAVAYWLLILRPALAMSAVEKAPRYALLRAVKDRLRRVVGGAVVTLLASGFWLAHVRGLLDGGASAFHRRVFVVKLVAAGLLVLVFLTALPLLARVKTGARRGWLFNAVHVLVLLLGLVAMGAGVALSR